MMRLNLMQFRQPLVELGKKTIGVTWRSLSTSNRLTLSTPRPVTHILFDFDGLLVGKSCGFLFLQV